MSDILYKIKPGNNNNGSIVTGVLPNGTIYSNESNVVSDDFHSGLASVLNDRLPQYEVYSGIGGVSSQASWGSVTGTLSDQADLNSALNNRVRFDQSQSLTSGQTNQARTNIQAQEVLVSGENIKNINGQSLLGSGNITLGGATNLSLSNHSASGISVNSDTGTDVVLPAATTSLAGLMTADDKSRLDNVLSLLSNAYVTLIATGATNENVQFSAAADYTVLWWDGTRTNHVGSANATKQITSTYSNRELQCYVFEQNASNNLTMISTGANVVGLIANSHTTLATVRCGTSLQILDVSNCRNLSSIDATVVTPVRMVDATNCRLLTQFSDSNRFQSLETLILDGCVHPDLKISYYVAGSNLKNISCRGVAPAIGYASTTVNSTSTVITEHYGIDFNGSSVRKLIIEKVFNDLGEESGWIDIRNTPDAATVDTSIATAKGYTVFTI